MVNGLATVEQEAPSLMMSVPQQQKAALTNAASLAADVAEIVRKNGLSKRFGSSPKEHVFVEGWLTISRVNNEAPHAKIEEVQKLEDGTELIKARAWITDAHGAMVSEADGYCADSEPNWKNKPFYARASMAQTRAIGKAMRLRHAWVMVMAGFSPTPAEEMDGVLDAAPALAKPAKKEYKLKPVSAPAADDDRVPAEVTDAQVSTPAAEPLVVADKDLELVDLEFYSKEKVDAKGRKYRGVKLGPTDDDWWNCYDVETIGNLQNLKGKRCYAKLEVKGTFKLCHNLTEATNG